jgi:hypothetical protein
MVQSSKTYFICNLHNKKYFIILLSQDVALKYDDGFYKHFLVLKALPMKKCGNFISHIELNFYQGVIIE